MRHVTGQVIKGSIGNFFKNVWSRGVMILLNGRTHTIFGNIKPTQFFENVQNRPKTIIELFWACDRKKFCSVLYSDYAPSESSCMIGKLEVLALPTTDTLVKKS